MPMKVDITHDEVTKGLVFKKQQHVVAFRVEFTEAEKKVIKEHNMAFMELVDLPPKGSMHRTVRPTHFLKTSTDKREFDTKYEAQQFDDKLVASLKQLKAMIEKRGGVTTASKSFDL
jgi:hypothetical protein